MAFQLPTDLINQVQIAARNAAALNSYNPDDPSLPCLPSFNASILGLDPSVPDHLRCKNCKAKLLRGVDSVICIYCGKQQINKDHSLDPICFTNTFGYQWLLHSLDLDQSETVGPSTEESGSNRGDITPYQETSLHHLLDLQITWPDELEVAETTLPHKTSEQSSSSFNLRGADADNVFSGLKRNPDVDASAQLMTEQQLDSVESKGPVTGFGSVQENPTSFEDIQGDSHSGWAADFQSANKEESSNSYDPFVASNIDLSSHIDSIFGAGKDENREKLADDIQPSQSVSHDWMRDDLWKNVDSKVSQRAVQFGSTAEATDGISPNNYKIPPSEGVDRFEDNQWQKYIASEPSNNMVDNLDDSFDDWNDFASSSNVVNLSGDEPSNKTIDKFDDSFDDWNDFASTSDAVNLSGGEPSNKITDKPVDSFDDWNDFASSSNVLNISGDEPSNKIIDKPDDSFDGWNDFPGLSNDASLSGNEPSSKIIDKPDDSFDDWNDFASKSNVDLSGNAWKDSNHQLAVSSEQTSEINLFSSTGNIQDNKFGSFSQPEIFSGSPGGYDSDANILKEVHASGRNNNEQSLVKELPEETVGQYTGESELNKRHITPNQEASLHHIVDLNTTRLNDLEMLDTSVPHKTPEQSSSSFNPSGADLDNVFSGSKKNVDSDASAQPITEKQLDSVESKGSISGFGSVQENLTLFSDDHSAESADVKSLEDNQRISFSEWPADFQSGNKDESSNSYDSFVASNIDLSSHLDSFFGARIDGNHGKLADDLQPVQSLSHDWMQDFWKNVDSKVPQQAVHFEITAEATDGISPNNYKIPASEGVDWLEDNQRQKNITSKPSNKIIDKDADTSDHCTDFASSINAQKLSGDERSDKRIDENDDSSDDWTDFKSSSNALNLLESKHSNNIIGKPDDSFDAWNDFASSSNAVNLSGEEPSTKIIDKPDNIFDAWNDFASSSNAQKLSGDEPSDKIIDENDDSFDDWTDFKSSSNALNLLESKYSNNIIGKPDDSFDGWNDFASSSSAVNFAGEVPSSKIIDEPDASFDGCNDFASSSNAVNLSGDEPSCKIIDKSDDTSDDWNDFASSSNAVNFSGAEPSGKIIDKPDDSFAGWNDFANPSQNVNLSANEPSSKIIDKPDDPFDDWNDFASINIGFSSFSHPNIFSGVHDGDAMKQHPQSSLCFRKEQ
ncbi:hypothetical protein POM88_017234 [Heracleum sosnowskyi]|uniref:DUF7815 domain-containing protein n=1 Tax=Heracleum sosnowskyi TaxID=360622 RepID=A0AAD8MXW5_9APIA|nr:hypothetical protein POM88_017234 [Heracleum sosnowskyi]